MPVTRSCAALLVALSFLLGGCPVPEPSPEAVWLTSLERRDGLAVVDGSTRSVTWAAIPRADLEHAKVAPLLGRWPLAVDEAVLSHRLWTETFDDDPAVVGREIELDNRARLVVGVLPEDLGDTPGLWVVIE
jgi:hypothetical protein